jgi:hypothetical protein
MCTYCTSTNYRKIYGNHNGLIPKEADGRTYEIHHIDGNHSNNDPTNLKAVTIQEHYDIHYVNGDWGACFKIAKRMELSPKEISELVSKSSCERVKNGTHHFLGGEIQSKTNKRRVKNGTHNFLGGEFQRKKVEDGTHHLLGPDVNKKRIENGTHHFLGENNPSRKKVEAGTHHFLGNEMNRKRVIEGTHHFQDKEAAKKRALKRINEGTHPWLGENHPSKIKCSCVVCHKETTRSGLVSHKCNKNEN